MKHNIPVAAFRSPSGASPRTEGAGVLDKSLTFDTADTNGRKFQPCGFEQTTKILLGPLTKNGDQILGT